MKKEIVIILLFLFTGVKAQITPSLVASINVTDLSNRSQTLQFGLDPLATDGIDSNFGEYLLPPLPPSGVFDARFILNDTENTLTDIRTGTNTSFITKEHIIKYQVGTGTTIKVTWNLPKGVIGKLQDRVTGNMINVNMTDQGSYTVTNPGTITSVKMTVTYLLGELAVPTLISPLKNATGILLTPTLIWNSTEHTTSYELQVATDELFGNIIYKDSTLIDTIKQIGPINGLTNYYWRVRGKNAKGYSSWSEVWNFKTLGVPTTVSLIEPQNGSENQKINITFKWSKAKDQTVIVKKNRTVELSPNGPNTVSNYWIEIVKDTLSQSGKFQDSTLVDTFKVITNLEYLTKYFWRIKSKNQAGWNEFTNWNNFTTIIEKPGVPVLALPLNNSVGNQQPIIVKWNKSHRVETYRVQVSKDSSFTTMIVNDSTLTDTVKQITELSNLTKYYWRVQAKNIGGECEWSVTWNFKTLGVPTTVSLLEPQNGSANQSLSITFKWSKAEDQTVTIKKKTREVDFSLNDQSTVSNYWFEMVRDTISLNGILKDEALTDTFKIVINLDFLTQYYWRVKSKNQVGWSEFTDWSYFTTIMEKPTIPLLKTPQNNAIVSFKPVLKWGTSLRAENYNLQVSKDASFNYFLLNDSTLTDTTKTIDSLEYKTTYYWRVSAKNIGGTSDFSEVGNFTTMYKPLIAPTNLTITASDSSREVKISWEDNSDNEQGFYIQRKTGNLSSLIPFAIIDTVLSNITSITDTKFFDDTLYTYRIYAFNEDTVSNFSDSVIAKIISDVEWSDERPTVYNLWQNYPNPFNPSTVIRYALPFDSKVLIKIFNTLGQEVAILEDEIVSAGNYEVQFNSENLSSGIYFYRISAESIYGKEKYTSIKKMILLK
jgi:hypothetical protein